jgi:anion-transporting  ArsA/GET3 family ATPase
VNANTGSGVADVVSRSRIVITCGAGGVGKTTTAAAIGLAAARHTSARVLVVTIDPAKRLADALGLDGVDGLGNVERRVGLDAPTMFGRSTAPGGHDRPDTAGDTMAKGELWVAMLDTSASWDDLIRRHATDAATATKILANPLYRNITQRFVQSHDYIAMERLYDLHAEGRFDLIVIDTPPSRHALDFLDAPERMADFFSSSLLKWITLPYRTLGARAGRLGYLASRPFYQVADRILGSQFLQDIAEFFLLFQGMYAGFVERANAVASLLHDPATTFVVVSSPEPSPLHEAEFFMRELSTRRLHLGALVLNRVLPDLFEDRNAREEAQRLVRNPGKGRMSTDDRVAVEVAASFLRFATLADRQRAEIRRLASTPEVTVTVPLLSEDVADISGVESIAKRVWGTVTPPVSDPKRRRRS